MMTKDDEGFEIMRRHITVRGIRIISLILVLKVLTYALDSAVAQRGNVPPIRTIPEVETLFAQGVKEYKAGDFRRAQEIFQRIVEQFPPNQRITAARLMWAKSLYKLRAYERAVGIARNLLEKFPGSNYGDDARFVLASCNFRQGNYSEALRQWLWVLDTSSDRRLRERSENLSLKLIGTKLSLGELKALREQSQGENAQGILTVKVAQRLLELGDKAQAMSVLEDFLAKNPKSPYASQAEGLLSKARSYREVGLRIGVILPLSGALVDEGKGVLRGIEFAVREFNATTQVPVELVVRDSQAKMVKTVKAAQDLIENERVLALIGELESDKTVALALVAAQSGVPLVAPTATESGIASLGPTIFQANSNLELRARRLAQYAFQQLGLRTFATLAPEDEYGKEMTESFVRTIEGVGGMLLTQQWYARGPKGVGKALDAIREAGLRKAREDSLLAKRDASAVRDEQGEQPEKELSPPVTSIDGLFLPVYTEDIRYIAPQLALRDIRTQLLGGDDWFDLDILRSNQSYVNGVIFTRDKYVNEEDPVFRDFRNRFRREMSVTPERFEIYGYDAISVVLQTLRGGATTREQLGQALSEVANFQGMGGRITFRHSDRVNSGVNLLQFIDGRILPIP